MVAPRAKGSTRAPKPEHVLEAVRFLQEGLSIPDVYLRAILDLVEAEYARRARARRAAA